MTKDTTAAANPPAQGKQSFTFKQLQELSRDRTPIIYYDWRSHEDIEFAYISAIIIRYNEEKQKFELSVELYDKCGHSVTIVSPTKIRVKELENA